MDEDDFKERFAVWAKETEAFQKDIANSDEGDFDDEAMANVVEAMNYEVQNGDNLASLLFKAYREGLRKSGYHLIKYRQYNLGKINYRLAIYNKDLTAKVGDQVLLTYVNEEQTEPKDFWFKVTHDDIAELNGLVIKFNNDNIKKIR